MVFADAEAKEAMHGHAADLYGADAGAAEHDDELAASAVIFDELFYYVAFAHACAARDENIAIF